MICFVINLERRNDRRQYVLEKYPENVHPSQIEIVKAYDGKIESNNSKDYIDLKNQFINFIESNKKRQIVYPYASYNPFTPGELGGWISHLAIWKRIVDENLNHAAIFEDDTLFSDDFNIVFRDIQKDLPNDFNIVWLGGKMVPNYIESGNLSSITPNLAVKKLQTGPMGTFAYIISKECANILYNYVKAEFRGNLGIDIFIYEFLSKNNIIEYQVNPNICYSISNKDSISKSDIQIDR